MEIKKSTFYAFGFFVLILIAGAFMLRSGDSVGEEYSGGQIIEGEMQRVVLSQDGYNYKDVVVESGKPIILSADDSVKGCLRSVAFNIGGKKYTKYLANPKDTMELPPLEKGTYNYACSMGMGFGKLIAN